MNYDKLNSITRQFLLGEEKVPSVYSYIQSIEETLSKLTPKTKTDTRRIEVAKTHLKEIKRHTRRLQESVSKLEERLKILEESVEK